MSLREAASAVFGLAAILPVLVLVYVLSRAHLLGQREAQLGVVLAVVVSGLGFLVFRRMVDQIGRFRPLPPSPPVSAPEAGSVVAVPGLGQVGEIGQVTGAFYQMRG